jgi:NADPH:quinone reductase-like Zn-dependent oxidoreductase
MKAYWFQDFGPASETLEKVEIARPQPSQGEVLVQLKTTGVNPSDVKKRAGAFPDLLDNGPVIPHSDGAGVVVAVGEGVSPSRIGERVFVYQAQYERRFGTAAEYLSIADERAPLLPDNASFAVGASIGIPMMTAHRCVFADGDVHNHWVLVTGGSGRVGYYAIQLAKLAGAKVIATASNAEDTRLCLDMGAIAVVNHRRAGWGTAVLSHTGGAKIDRVIDVEFGANMPEWLSCVRIGATIATYSSTQVREPALPFLKMMFMDLTVRMVIVYAMPESAKTQAVEDIQRLLEENKLSHRIAYALSFDELPRAHEIIEQGGNGGCVIVHVNQ